jgi:crotonobetainyl-CoA:carnitine CoA-transferase CaiB-like acyl-CoA transferase
MVEPAVKARDARELEAALEQAGIPCSVVNNFAEVFDDPQIVARGVVQEIDHPQLGTMRLARNPVLLDRDGPELVRPAPMLGQHSEEVLRELGLSGDAIAALAGAGITRLAPASAGTEAAE